MKHRSATYAALVAAAPDAIIVMDEDSTILDANAAVHELFGYAPEELIGKDLTTIMPPSLAPRHKAGFSRYLQTGKRNIHWSGIRLQAQHKDGSPVDVDVSFTEVQEESGRIFAGIIRDVTARTWAERRLTTQFRVADLLGKATDLASAGPALLEAIAEPLGWKWGGLWIVDGFRLRSTAEWPTGQAEHAMVGRTFAKGEGLPGRVWENSRPAWIANLEGDKNFPRVQLASSLGLHTGMAFPICLQDEVLGVMEFFTTDARPADEDTLQLVHAIGQQIGQFIARSSAQAALRDSHNELEGFAATASHDLQEPLRAITIFTDLLQKKTGIGKSSEEAEMLGTIRTAATSMQSLITDLLIYAHANKGETVLQEESLEEVLRRVLEVLSAQIKNSGAVITHGPLARFMVSATDLHQILQNLLSNGMKYSKPGEPPRIHVAATIQGSRLECSVTDNGQGIPPQHHEQIFEPFKRLHTREVPGSGLGLAICKRLVERHGGSISVASPPEGGTRFTFTLGH